MACINNLRPTSLCVLRYHKCLLLGERNKRKIKWALTVLLFEYEIEETEKICNIIILKARNNFIPWNHGMEQSIGRFRHLDVDLDAWSSATESELAVYLQRCAWVTFFLDSWFDETLMLIAFSWVIRGCGNCFHAILPQSDMIVTSHSNSLPPMVPGQ